MLRGQTAPRGHSATGCGPKGAKDSCPRKNLHTDPLCKLWTSLSNNVSTWGHRL